MLAIVFPGAGHVYLKQARRGVLASVGVLGLFLGGMLIGGVDVVDRREDKYWFIGQAMVGPIAFGVDWYHQNMLKAYPMEPSAVRLGEISAPEFARMRSRSVFPGEVRRVGTLRVGGVERRVAYVDRAGEGEGPANTKSLGRMNELGMLSTTIAGMLNFIIVLDALFPGMAGAVRGGERR